jgi:hypothetical protein
MTTLTFERPTGTIHPHQGWPLLVTDDFLADLRALGERDQTLALAACRSLNHNRQHPAQPSPGNPLIAQHLHIAWSTEPTGDGGGEKVVFTSIRQ